MQGLGSGVVASPARSHEVQPRANWPGGAIVKKGKDAIHGLTTLGRLCAIQVIPPTSGVGFDVEAV